LSRGLVFHGFLDVWDIFESCDFGKAHDVDHFVPFGVVVKTGLSRVSI